MISSLAWIPRGAARSRPVKYELSHEEVERIKELAAREEGLVGGHASAATEDSDSEEENEGTEAVELPAEYDMQHYDSDPEENLSPEGEERTGSFTIFEQGNRAFAVEADSDDEDAEDDEIRQTDALLVVAMTEDEFSHLEVQVLSEDGNMFVHHDIQLPEFPLCTAWLDCPPFQILGGQQSVGNYIAVGSFNPAIEIWNLDVLDPLEPTAVLGGEEQDTAPPSKGKKGKKKQQQLRGPVLKADSHRDAVMSLSWNKVYRQALASGSADMTVKIWDVTTQACSHTFTHHTGKVQSVVFHPEEAWRLATGSYDKSVALIDCRSGSLSCTYTVPADMESMAWDPFQPYHLYAALENGVVVCIDVRQHPDPLFSFQAHKSTVSSLGFSAGIPGMLCTASEDKTVKVWDVASCQAGAGAGGALVPDAVAYKTMNVGKLFALQFFPDNAFTLAVGGDEGMVAVWESDEMEELQKRFSARVQVRENPYLGLSGSGGAATSSISTGGANMEQEDGEAAAAVEDEDDSWMDEPQTAAAAGGGGQKSKTRAKDKKKRDKVVKSSI